MDDEDRLMSTRHPDVDVAKPAVRATDGVKPAVAIVDGSRSLSMMCPPVADDVKPVVMKTPASRARLSVRGRRLLVMELNFASRLMSTECPHVDVVKPATMATDGGKPAVAMDDGSRPTSTRTLPVVDEMESAVRSDDERW